jgi:uncharacterized protein with gpF-like domain
MIKLQESDYKIIEDQLIELFYEWYYKPIIDLMDDKRFNQLYNSNNALISAIRRGTVKYKDGIFDGSFNSRISKELSRFAKYNGRKKQWEGMAPPDVTAAAMIANDKMQKLNERIKAELNTMEARVQSAINNLPLRVEEVINDIDGRLVKEVKGITVLPEITEDMRKSLTEKYTENMELYVKDWNPEQIKRLRVMVENNIRKGLNRQDMQDAIMSEFGTTRAKAQFLARNEVSLWLSEMRNERFNDAGIEIYKWSTSNDSRVVGTPGGKWPEPSKGHGNHYLLQGRICRLDDPTVYADNLKDAKAGKWKSKLAIGAGDKHPGQEYLCRCGMIPVLLPK